MNKTKFFSLLFIAGGMLFCSYGIWGIGEITKQTNHSLAEAKEAIQQPKKEWKDNQENRFVPPIGEAVGMVEIPKINGVLPIVEGTEADDLAKGVGHYRGSFFPKEKGQIVLSGHRDTVFRRAGELETGDTIMIVLPYGKFEYKITSSKIVEADDTSVITLDNKKEELVLTTCYPFSYIGNAPQRYILYAKPI
ncbi:MAG: class D sortase [Bacillus sp. (in: firmicutes)]